jgi:hypothetical protein
MGTDGDFAVVSLKKGTDKRRATRWVALQGKNTLAIKHTLVILS